MLVTPIEARDHASVAAIAAACGSEIDLDAELARQWARIWVARKAPEADPIGFLLVWLVADELHVIHVATDPNSRRQGVGSALLVELLAVAKQRRSRLVLLEVRRSNREAIRLYRAHGFSAYGVRRGYYAEGSEDAIEMMLALDPATGEALPGKDEIDLGA
jgi:[ribosomal protein S18]-alanine N-acetyltransferase